MNPRDNGLAWSETTTGTTVIGLVHATSAGFIHYIAQATVSSDTTTSTMLIKDGGTTIWQVTVGATKHTENFMPELKLTSGQSARIEVIGNASCKANFSGYTV